MRSRRSAHHRFTHTAPANGSFNDTITAAVSAGTSYTSATATAGK
jgi:hypothetical protein